MINIAICDDDVRTIEKIITLVDGVLFDSTVEYKIYTFTSGHDFICSDIKVYNIVLLDVELGEENGIEIASDFRKSNKEAVLVFISQFIEYTPEGYTVNAYRYILKPNLDRLFNRDFTEAVKEVTKSKKEFRFKFKKEYYSIPIDDIIYFESINNKTLIHSASGNNDYEFYLRLDEIEEDVGKDEFLRIQQSLLVNIRYIAKVSSYIAKLKNGQELPTSRKNYKELCQSYAKMKWRYIDGIHR